jgi:hypothetical protein
MPAFGAYPVADARVAGTEISSTYEGRHLTFLETEITHSGAFPTKGIPVVVGNQIVGVPFTTLTAATQYCAIDTEGIWVIDVVATDDAGNSAVAGGDLLYINTTTCVVSKISNAATQIPFGYALGIITGGNTDTIAVKIHYDPSLDNARQTYRTIASGAYSYGKQFTGILAAGESTAVALYANAQPSGVQTGGIYAGGIWMEPGATFADNGGLLVGWDVGFWAGGAGEDITSSRVIAVQMMVDLAANPGSIAWFRVNVAASSGAMTTIFEAANPASLAYSAGTAGTGVVGTIPFADIVGVGVVYIDVHAAVA